MPKPKFTREVTPVTDVSSDEDSDCDVDDYAPSDDHNEDADVADVVLEPSKKYVPINLVVSCGSGLSSYVSL